MNYLELPAMYYLCSCRRLAILAFHKALVDKPRDPLVVAAFSFALHSSGSLLEAIEIARGINELHDSSYIELQEAPVLHSKLAMRDEVIDLAASIKDVLFKMTSAHYVSQAMSMYPQAPRTDLVRTQFFLRCGC